jgi:hypothetical protein
MNHALLIGINYYNTPYTLQGCIEDVQQMKTILQTHYDYTSIQVLQDNDPNNLPTRNNIINRLQNLVNLSGSFKSLYIHYSGHGTNLISKTEKDGYDECIVPCDFQTNGLIIDDTLNNILKNSKCPTRCVFDSCHSGTIVDLKYTMRFTPQRNFAYNQETVSNINDNIMTLSACLDSETATDAYNTQLKTPMGALTMMLIRVLTNNQFKNITNKVLLNELSDNLKINRYSQQPMISSSKPMNDTDVFFTNTNAPQPVAPKPAKQNVIRPATNNRNKPATLQVKPSNVASWIRYRK